MKNRCPLKRFEKNPIITPDDMPFECYAVFNAGAVLSDDRRLMIYYGGADTSMCVAEAPLDELVSFCLDE